MIDEEVKVFEFIFPLPLILESKIHLPEYYKVELAFYIKHRFAQNSSYDLLNLY